MTISEFRTRWNSNEDGGGITVDDIADCAIEWGLIAKPRTRPINKVINMVIRAAGLE